MLVSLALLLIITLFISPSLAHEKHATLKKICSKTFNTNWCMELMKKDSRTSNADNRGEVTIGLAFSTALDIQKQLNDRIYTDCYNPKLKDLFVACSKDYEDIVRDLERTKKHFSDGYTQRLAAEAENVLEEVNECNDNIDRQNRREPTKLGL